MLIYHPAFDAYHCVFRMLALLSVIPKLESEKARILDFYLIFPSAIKDITLPRNLSAGKRLAKTSENVYHDPIDPSFIFRDMHAIQKSAFNCIAASGIVKLSEYEQGLLVRTEAQLPIELGAKVNNYLAVNVEVAEFVLRQLASLPLRGLNGLKHRTGLLEYKYDIS